MLSEKEIHLHEKIFNYRGFFCGIIAAKIRFNITNEKWHLVDWNKVEIFLRLFNSPGMSVNKNGKLVNVVFPFSDDYDIELAKYFFSNKTMTYTF
jgi:hypothetical protein